MQWPNEKISYLEIWFNIESASSVCRCVVGGGMEEGGDVVIFQWDILAVEWKYTENVYLVILWRFHLKVSQRVCCRQKHRLGGDHYHLAIKLDRNQRWMMSKRYLQRTYGITVHYSSRHHNYYSALLYVTKSDRDFKESSGHPDLRSEVHLELT